jgi:RecA-family ATPase
VKEVVFRNRRRKMKTQLNITTRKQELLTFLNVPDSNVGWENILTLCKNHGFDVVFADPFYQISNINENDQSACNEVINTIKRFKAEGITLIVLFRAPKGFEGDKPLIDLVSGHGVLTRSPDGMCGILKHSNNKSSRVFRTELRNDASLDDFTITFNDGIWEVNSDVSPTVATARSHAQNANNNKVSNDAIDEAILTYIEQMQKEDGYNGLGISIGDFVPSVKEAMEESALTVSEKRIKTHLKRLNKEKKLYIEEKSGVKGGIKFVGELAMKTRWEEKRKAKEEAKRKQNTGENETGKKAKK